MKSMLNSNITYNINFTTFVPRKSVFIHSFFIVTSSVLIIFVIMLKYDVFKLSIYLNIYFFFLHRNFDRPKCWGISFKDSKFIQVITLRWLKITCLNKTSKFLLLKLTADLIQAYQQHWHYRESLIVSLRLFPTC